MLGRPLKAPQVRRVIQGSRSKVANIIQIRHRDEVETPVTDWLQEAYELPDVLAAATTKTTDKAVRKRRRVYRRDRTVRNVIE